MARCGMKADLLPLIFKTLTNKLHGPTHCKIDDSCVYQWTCFLYSVVITQHSNPPISQFNSLCNDFLVNVLIQYQGKKHVILVQHTTVHVLLLLKTRTFNYRFPYIHLSYIYTN